MRFRKRARMMQPPRQIFASSPIWRSQSYVRAAAAICSKPCA